MAYVKLRGDYQLAINYDLLPANTGLNALLLTDRQLSIVRRVCEQVFPWENIALHPYSGQLGEILTDAEGSAWSEELELIIDKLSGGLSMNQNANTVLAGPAAGAAAAPGFRSLVAADVPASSFHQVTPGGTLTIASGVITVTSSQHAVDTEAAAASDNLDTINPLVAGRLLVLYTVNSAHDVVLKHNTGNILTRLGGDLTLGSSNRPTLLVGLPSYWVVLSDYGS